MFGHRIGRACSRARRLPFLALVTGLLVLLPAMAGLSADVPIATIPVGDAPVAVGVNPISHRVYVPNYYGSSVSIIDGASDTVTATVSLGDFTVPIAVVANPLATPARAYVANFWTNTVSVLDESTNAVSAVVPSNGAHAGGPRALALDPSGASPKLYVANYGSALVTVIDAETYAILGTIPTGANPRAMGIFASASRTRVYVANRGSATVTVIDGDTDQVVANLPVGSAPKAIAVDQSTGYAYVTNEGGNTVTVIDDNDQVAGTVSVGARPIGIAIDESAGRVFVANYNSNSVSVIRTSDFSHEATLTVGTNPWAIAFDQGDNKAFVTNYGSNSTSVIDSALTVTNVACGTNPYALAVDEGATPHKTYVGNWNSDDVTVIDEPPGPSALQAMRSEAFAAAESAVQVSIDPEVSETSGTVLATGSATDVRTKYPAAIAAVFYRVAPSKTWLRADITGGENTTAATWAADLGALADGTYDLEVIALDQTSATSAVSDGGAAVSGSSVGGTATAHLDVGREPHETSTSLSLQRRSFWVPPQLVTAVTCPEPGCDTPSGQVVFEKLVRREWVSVGTATLVDGTGRLTIGRLARGTYRARYLGDERHLGSTSGPLAVRFLATGRWRP